MHKIIKSGTVKSFSHWWLCLYIKILIINITKCSKNNAEKLSNNLISLQQTTT